MQPAVFWRPLPTYYARLCTWAESTWWVVLIAMANKMQYLWYSWTYQTIQSIMKPVFRPQYWWICCTYELLRRLDLHIWWFLCWRWLTIDKTDYLTPCTCAQGNKFRIVSLLNQLRQWLLNKFTYLTSSYYSTLTIARLNLPYGDTAKPGLWTLDWTVDWTMDWTGDDQYQFSEAENSVLKVGWLTDHSLYTAKYDSSSNLYLCYTTQWPLLILR